jgi:hypothetical protein
MHREKYKIAVGIRFITDKLGAVRCPSLAGKAGTVIECSRDNTGLTVLLATKDPTCLHTDYFPPTSEQHQDAQPYPGGYDRLSGLLKSLKRAP